MMVILSDTHENLAIIQKAVRMIKEINPEIVVHCGDIVSPPTLEEFKDLPMRFVFGNNDGDVKGLKKKCRELGFPEIAGEIEFEYCGKKFYVYHGTDERIINEMVALQVYDYVLHGHTHRTRDEKIGITRIINPGALFMAKDFTMAKLDVVDDNLEFLTI